MIIHIGNMVSPECGTTIGAAFRELRIRIITIRPGEVETASPVKFSKLLLLKGILERAGYSILVDKKKILVEKIKLLIIYLVHHEVETRLKLSEYIAGELQYDYHYLSSLFSEMEGITIEKYLISERVKKAKELLKEGELSISEVARKLKYSSAAYLTIQFKKSTGVTPGEYRKSEMHSRMTADML